MRRIITSLLLSLFSLAGAAQVQPMNLNDYGFPNHGNFGAGVLRSTNSAAYLEVGRPSGSRKGFMLPRGNKDSVFNLTVSAEGILFYDLLTHQPWYWNGTAYVPWGSDSGSGSTTTSSFDYLATGGETDVSTSSLSGKTLLSVTRGAGTVQVITSGTPSANQALFNPATGGLTFGARLDASEYVLILFK